MDYLIKAVEKRKKANEEIKNRNFNLAWGLLQEVADIYVEYVNYQNKTHGNIDQGWAIGLINSVEEERAIILGKENKHKQALFHATLKAVTENRPIKKYKEKMMVYFRKANLNATEAEFLAIYSEALKNKSALFIREKIENLS